MSHAERMAAARDEAYWSWVEHWPEAAADVGGERRDVMIAIAVLRDEWRKRCDEMVRKPIDIARVKQQAMDMLVDARDRGFFDGGGCIEVDPEDSTRFTVTFPVHIQPISIDLRGV